MWWKGLENCQKLLDALCFFLLCTIGNACSVVGVGETTYDERLNKRGPSVVGCANERSRGSSVHGMGSDGGVDAVRNGSCTNRPRRSHATHRPPEGVRDSTVGRMELENVFPDSSLLASQAVRALRAPMRSCVRRQCGSTSAIDGNLVR